MEKKYTMRNNYWVMDQIQLEAEIKKNNNWVKREKKSQEGFCHSDYNDSARKQDLGSSSTLRALSKPTSEFNFKEPTLKEDED